MGWRDRGPWPLVASSSACPGPQAIVTLGAAAGGVLGGWLVDRVGRKLSLLLCTLPFVTGFAIITAAWDVWLLLGGRLLTGLACGVASLVAPVSGLGLLDDLCQGQGSWSAVKPFVTLCIALSCAFYSTSNSVPSMLNSDNSVPPFFCQQRSSILVCGWDRLLAPFTTFSQPHTLQPTHVDHLWARAGFSLSQFAPL